MIKNSVTDLWNFITDPDPDPALSVCDLRDANKKYFEGFLLISFWPYIYIILQRKKILKKSQNSINQGFSYFFCLVKEGSGSESGSIPLTNGSGLDPGGPKIYRSYGSGSGTLIKSIFAPPCHQWIWNNLLWNVKFLPFISVSLTLQARTIRVWEQLNTFFVYSFFFHCNHALSSFHLCLAIVYANEYSPKPELSSIRAGCTNGCKLGSNVPQF